MSCQWDTNILEELFEFVHVYVLIVNVCISIILADHQVIDHLFLVNALPHQVRFEF